MEFLNNLSERMTRHPKASLVVTALVGLLVIGALLPAPESVVVEAQEQVEEVTEPTEEPTEEDAEAEQAAQEEAEDALRRREETLERQSQEREQERVEQEQPEPEPEPRAARGTYGSDPVLDRLQDRCSDGDMDACDDLFWDSPLGSEYESYAQEQRYGVASNDDLFTDEEFNELAFTLAWSGMSAREQADICDGYNLFGPEFMYEPFAEGWGEGAPSLAEFRSFFDSKC